MMNLLPSDFHLLRPEWLWLILPALLLFLGLWQARGRSSRWDRAISSSLLPHLLDGQPGGRQRLLLISVLTAWLLAILAVTGPVWQKIPQPVQKKETSLIIIQDLSLSLYANDLSPNRLTRARHKLLDILRNRKEGTTALIVYAGDAHVVSPLTDDSNTIAAMVPDLSPTIMPSFGSNVAAAVTLALQLLKDTGFNRSHLLLLTDEVEEIDRDRIRKLLAGKDVPLSILGIGTEDGAPIPKADGGFLQDDTGAIIVPRLNRSILKSIATDNGGRYSDIRFDDTDLDYLLAAEPLVPEDDEYRLIERDFDQWHEEGHLLLLLLLPVALLAFRRGWLIGIVLLVMLSATESQAMTWQDLWLRKDQQATRAMAASEPAKAATLFESSDWRATASYRAGNYEAAAEIFAEKDAADAHYNRGNSLDLYLGRC